MKRVGIDIGGTFTDLVVLDEATGAMERTKTPTTPLARQNERQVAHQPAPQPPQPVRPDETCR